MITPIGSSGSNHLGWMSQRSRGSGLGLGMSHGLGMGQGHFLSALVEDQHHRTLPQTLPGTLSLSLSLALISCTGVSFMCK